MSVDVFTNFVVDESDPEANAFGLSSATVWEDMRGGFQIDIYAKPDGDYPYSNPWMNITMNSYLDDKEHSLTIYSSKKDEHGEALINKKYHLIPYTDEELAQEARERLQQKLKMNKHLDVVEAINNMTREEALEAVTKDGRVFDWLTNEDFRKDRDIVLATVKSNGNALRYADNSFRKDREIVLTAVSNDGMVLEVADESFKKDKEIVLAALNNCHDALRFVDESLRNDPDIIAVAGEYSETCQGEPFDLPF